MKKRIIIIGLAAFLAIGLAGTSWGLLCLDLDSYCNDYVFGVSGAGGGIYGIHGYEYGCGYDNRTVDGSLHVAGGFAYFGINKQLPGGDANSLGNDTYVIDLSSDTGSVIWMYFGSSGGSVTTWNGTDSVTFQRSCSPSAEALSLDPDNSQ